MSREIIIPDRIGDKIVSLYKKEKSLTVLKNTFQYTQSTIYRYLKKRMIDTTIDYVRNGQRIRQFNIDEHFFKKINNRVNAYVFGWLMSDGCMYDYDRNRQIRLKITDIEMLEEIKAAMKYERNLFLNKKELKHHKQCKTLIISSVTMFDDLVKLGCTPRKSLTKKFPINVVPKNLFNDFIRGYFDGNGSVYIYKQGGDNLYGEVKIMSSKLFCVGLYDFLSRMGIKCQLGYDKRADENSGAVRIRSLSSVIDFFKYIYKDIDGQLSLQRKRNKYIELLKNRKL